ncbi:MAG: hypothetical protein K6G26_02270, partial [Lachnospiraceae bacterium]|nr:hypothetical protein [Lachnospiraceae bacterium]
MIQNRLNDGERITLCGVSDGEKFSKTFEIRRFINAGGTAICYDVWNEESGAGVLKEFYPGNVMLQRKENNNLVLSKEFPEQCEIFEKEIEDNRAIYDNLIKIKHNNSVLSTFIPYFEIFYGNDIDTEKEISTMYIWTQGEKLRTFEDYCNEIRDNVNESAEDYLKNVFSALIVLTECICELHKARIIHRDIKPSNFGFVERGENLNEQTISIFDINTICSSNGGKAEKGIGTDGYMEPEAFDMTPTIQTDIFSIGATLFSAIILTDEVKNNNYRFNRSFFNRLEELVRESNLMSGRNFNGKLRTKITNILKNTLSNRKSRYKCCEELRDDLKEVYDFITRLAENGKKDNNNAFLAIQHHMYKHPLFECCKDDEKDINVLILGLKDYGRNFLDSCLQNGQIADKTLNVKVITNETDKNEYLCERPTLKRFFNIDDNINEDTYGNISFVCEQSEFDNIEPYSLNVREFIDEPLHYVFVSIGDDRENYMLAKSCKEICDEKHIDSIIGYISEDTEGNDILDGIYPLYANKPFKSLELFEQINRMALNAHFVWEKSLNIDFRKVKEDFKEFYNYYSSVSNVVALKSKLFSLGIALDDNNYNQVAIAVNDLLIGENKKEIIEKLSWIEHRRWVTEKICVGYKPISDYKKCIDNYLNGLEEGHHNKKKKEHLCIVKSNPKSKLQSFTIEQWDRSYSNQELKELGLDPLEKASLLLHQGYVRHANSVNKIALTRRLKDDVLTRINNNDGAKRAFDELLNCIEHINNGERDQIKFYKGRKQNFEETIKGLDLENFIKSAIKEFEREFKIIIESMQYRDHKQDDIAFIENIPFILTYTEKACMVIPMDISGRKRFNNIAAATIVNPEILIYTVYIETREDADN